MSSQDHKHKKKGSLSCPFMQVGLIRILGLASLAATGEGTQTEQADA
jgi:hypothetical protein